MRYHVHSYVIDHLRPTRLLDPIFAYLHRLCALARVSFILFPGRPPSYSALYYFNVLALAPSCAGPLPSNAPSAPPCAVHPCAFSHSSPFWSTDRAPPLYPYFYSAPTTEVAYCYGALGNLYSAFAFALYTAAAPPAAPSSSSPSRLLAGYPGGPGRLGRS